MPDRGLPITNIGGFFNRFFRVIFINGKLFRQCKYLLMNLSIDDATAIEDLKSVDEISDTLDNQLEFLPFLQDTPAIPPEVEFWGHCSNLQVWYENEYSTGLLHSNIAFPLLKELHEAGDPLARKVFVEEIGKRFDSEYLPVMLSLMMGGYLDYLSPEEIETLEFFKKMRTSKVNNIVVSGGNPREMMFDNFKRYLIDLIPKTVTEWVIKAKMLRIFKTGEDPDECFKKASKSFPRTRN